ncbi:MAG: hypothetical protein HC886_06940 [Leptolyngbyaceae cyanobacterium SM1_1_3]|nr:hypothetical protein [Leptolyngbyaceae cyanobacterium SM1_1_3]
MTQHWAVVVGINQYQSLQPLLYARQDAIALWHFLTQTARYDPAACLLLSDPSNAQSSATAYPNKQSLLHQIQQCQEQLQPNDVLWFFFSGYGICYQDCDYLLPIDVDPAHIPETACSVQSLFELFKQSPTDNIVIMLDINRSQAALADRSVGQQSLALARDFGLSLILSSQPQEFSHETLAVKHGLFTAALLEGLDHRGCVTLDHIAAHLQKQLPELCEHHWRPTQNPAVQIPSEKRFLLVVPAVAQAAVPIPATATASSSPVRSPQLPVMNLMPTAPEPVPANVPSVSPRPNSRRPQPSSAIAPLAAIQRVGVWGPLALLFALLLLLLGRSSLLPPAPSQPESAPRADSGSSTSSSTAAATPPAPPPAAPKDASENAREPGRALFAEPLSGSATALSALTQAQQAIAQQRYAEAIRWLDQIPAAARDDTYNRLEAQAEAGLAQQVAGNQAKLVAVQQTVQPNQATSLSSAIAQLSQIPPGEPFYQESQQLIEQWSQALLGLANTAATQGDLASAIATARLVPQQPR